MNRTKNAVRNLIFGFINKFVILVFPFVIRYAMIKTLGSEYLGLNSLFTSILQVLNLVELGFNSAIIYSMYKPIAQNDTKIICALLNLYKKIYRYIGFIIIIIGLALLPFLKHLIKGSYPININIYILYLIYLANTVITYFLFAYKSALLTAHQRSDITSNVQTVAYLIQYLLQILVLVLFKNYYLFILLQIVTTICNNVGVAVITNKRYPKYLCCGQVDEITKKDIRKRVSGLLIQRICSTTRNSLDSIFISIFLGLNVVAMYSNYYSIISTAIGIMGIITTAIVAGIGNSIVTESEDKNYQDMNNFNFIYMWLAGWISVCLICLYQPLMKLWMGDELLFPFDIVILFCLYFYSLKMGDIRAVYSDAKGLWYENRYRAILESVFNVILNIILGKIFGIRGIILGTLISLIIINFFYGSQILFKYYFVNKKSSDYFFRHGLYFLVTLAICAMTYFICSLIKLDGILGLIIKLVVCIIIPNLIYLVVYFKTKIFKDSSFILKNILKLKKKLKK